MDDEFVPLVARRGTQGDEGGEKELLEDLLAGQNFKHLVESCPEEVVTLLAQHGTKKLLSFAVENDRVPDYVMEGGIMTMGADSMVPADIKERWLAKLVDPNPNQDDMKGWQSKVRLEALVVQVRNAADPEKVGIVQPLLMRYRAKLAPLQVFSLPAVRSVINFKWNHFAKYWLNVQLAIFLVWLISFNTFALMLSEEDVTKTLAEQFADFPRGMLTVSLDLLMLVGMMPFFIAELITVATYGFQRWLSVYNMIDVGTYVLQLAIVVTHMSRIGVESHALSVAVAVQALMLWTKFTYFLRAYSFNSTVDTVVYVVQQCSQMLLGIGIAIYSFAVAFNVLFRGETTIDSVTGERVEVEEFKDLLHSLTTMFEFLMGGFEFETFWNSKVKVTSFIFFLMYEFTLVIVLLNVIIASMEEAWNRFSENEDERFQLVRADMIDELETFLPNFLIRQKSSTRFPEYVHVLRLAQRPDEADFTHQWAEASRSITRLEGILNQKVAAWEESMGKRITALEQQIDKLVAALESKGKLT